MTEAIPPPQPITANKHVATKPSTKNNGKKKTIQNIKKYLKALGATTITTILEAKTPERRKAQRTITATFANLKAMVERLRS